MKKFLLLISIVFMQTGMAMGPGGELPSNVIRQLGRKSRRTHSAHVPSAPAHVPSAPATVPGAPASAHGTSAPGAPAASPSAPAHVPSAPAASPSAPAHVHSAPAHVPLAPGSAAGLHIGAHTSPTLPSALTTTVPSLSDSVGKAVRNALVILGFPEDTDPIPSKEQINKKYKNLALIYHPDKSGSDPTAFNKVKDARDLLLLYAGQSLQEATRVSGEQQEARQITGASIIDTIEENIEYMTSTSGFGQSNVKTGERKKVKGQIKSAFKALIDSVDDKKPNSEQIEKAGIFRKQLQDRFATSYGETKEKYNETIALLDSLYPDPEKAATKIQSVVRQRQAKAEAQRRRDSAARRDAAARVIQKAHRAKMQGVVPKAMAQVTNDLEELRVAKESNKKTGAKRALAYSVIYRGIEDLESAIETKNKEKIDRTITNIKNAGISAYLKLKQKHSPSQKEKDALNKIKHQLDIIEQFYQRPETGNYDASSSSDSDHEDYTGYAGAPEDSSSSDSEHEGSSSSDSDHEAGASDTAAEDAHTEHMAQLALG